MTTHVAVPLDARRGGAMVKLALAVVLVAGAGGGVYAWSRPGAKAKASGTSSEQATVETTSFDISTTSTGELKARNQIEIRSELETESTIVEIVKEGTSVQKGDLLIKLNGDQLQQQIDEQKLQVQSASAEVVAAENAVAIQESENQSKIRQAQLKVDLARLALDQWEKGEVVQKRKDIELSIETSRRDLERLTEKHEQNKALLEREFLSVDEFKQNEIAMLQKAADHEKALLERETYENFQYPKDQKQKLSDVTEAEAELERTKKEAEIQLASKQADLSKARETLRLRTEKLSKNEAQLAKCTIVAPQTGLVVYATSIDSDVMFFGGNGPLQIGRRVFPNESLIVLPDTSSMNATVRVHESLANRVRPGQSAAVKVEAIGGKTLTGKVDSIGILAESGGWRDPNRREYTVTIALDAIEEGVPLKPSMRCEAEIQLGRAEGVLTIPIQAVFNDGPVRYVYVPRGHKYARVPISMGQRSTQFAEVTVGVAAGDRVLLREPAPAEIVQEPWDGERLALVGLKLDERGQPIPAGGPAMGPGGGRAARGGGRGGPEGAPGAAPVVNAAPAAQETGKPEETSADEGAKTSDGEEVTADDAAPAAEPAEGSTTSEPSDSK